VHSFHEGSGKENGLYAGAVLNSIKKVVKQIEYIFFTQW